MSETVASFVEALHSKIAERTARVGVVGLGYVGLPLAVEFGKAGFTVLGFDTDGRKIGGLRRGESHIQDVSSEDVADLVMSGKFDPDIVFDELASCDAISICVPTPLSKMREPDISYIVSVLDQIAPRLRQGQLVVLESTTYPGTTDEVILPRLQEASGLKVGEDFFLAFSPERVDPGNIRYNTHNTPKVVGGVTPVCTKLAAALYGSTIETIIPVSSTRVAEMVKLIENTFRSVNIGLANELALMCDLMGLDVWEVIGAAASKPFGFMPFYPGPGVGGHCIPLDPIYLSWKARQYGHDARFIGLADSMNTHMPYHVVHKVMYALNQREKSTKGSNILVIGVAYKADIGDVRESPALDIIHLLRDVGGATVDYHDPLVPWLREPFDMSSVAMTADTLTNYNCVVIATAHSSIDWEMVAANASLIVDTRNAITSRGHDHVFRL